PPETAPLSLHDALPISDQNLSDAQASRGRAGVIRTWSNSHMGQYDGDPAWPSCSRRLARRGENIEAAVGHGGEKVLIVDAIRTHRTHGLPSGCQEGATRSLRRRSNGSDSRLFDRGVAQGSQSSIPRRRSSAGSAAFPDFPEIPSMP